ncbi:MAG: NAD+ synthase [Brevinematia bacterium]
MRIAVAQVNTIVGDVIYNYNKILDFTKKALKSNCDIIVFPELCTTGYPPEDLLKNKSFIEYQKRFFEKLKKEFKNIIGIVGFVDLENDVLYNSAGVIFNGKAYIYHKTKLPNYGVFDERRYFSEGNRGLVISVNNGRIKIGVTICEDIWYPEGVVNDEIMKGYANIIVNLSSSPYHLGKLQEKIEMLKTRARDFNTFIVYANLVGGQDELVFDGNSLVISPEGKILAKAKSFEEELLVLDIFPEETIYRRLLEPRYTFLIEDYKQRYEVEKITLEYETKKQNKLVTTVSFDYLAEEEEIIEALKTSVRDYITKNKFSKVVIGISGGIDSALVAYICTKALGKENVIGVSMPSMFSSEGTKSDARKLCENLGIKFLEIPIQKIFELYLSELVPFFEGKQWDITEENLQSRIRGSILMALSNKFGWIVMTTGNKSELSMGYVTLYGDTVGGFAPLKDIYKTTVYKLVKWINEKEGFDVIPRTIIERPPSAELRENQKDEDTLPPYQILDKILKKYIEEEKSSSEISYETNIDLKLVENVIKTVNKNEYKRRQAPVGTKITLRSFGKDRRYPITNRFENV